MPQKLLFEKAVQHLYGQGIITKDKDIADKTGYNKATVSSYVNGKSKISLEFIRTFEKSFNLKLTDFGTTEKIVVEDSIQLLTEKILLIQAELQTNRQMIIEVLASVSEKSVTEVQLDAERFLAHNLKKILSELQP